ncbi:MbcA/ParS/Xre antitoxin family protein [Deinococcus sp. KNUC1210]|uniref:MbcA/ParS/Xre antitoxin family protein n=1 Tax=Deinococcus sp. KNUC1210 TaxID=2917691 RepID=UPI001EF0BABF|nr:MbcA/ParS/Xre antitoxin family protein [Deinococcus sp. KNUC1210]ULH15494.1 MbcA/ParS/Xre antitoxin family protein [Deinococcus sp. KNUC1210]
MPADGSVPPAADLSPELLTAEEPGGIEEDVAAALADGHAPNADLRQPIETIQDFDRAVAELLSRTNADVISEASRLRDEASAARAMARSNRSFEVQAATDIEADRLLCLSDPTVPIDTEQSRIIEMEMDELLLETFGSVETVAAWLDAPNPVLAGDTPASYIRRGDIVAIRRLLRMAATGMPT